MPSNITTGPNAGVKNTAVNQSKVGTAQKAKETQEAEQKEKTLETGVVCYTKLGDSLFNCRGNKSRHKIQFKGGRFFVAPKDLNAEDIKETLEYFVTRGLLVKTEG